MPQGLSTELNKKISNRELRDHLRMYVVYVGTIEDFSQRKVKSDKEEKNAKKNKRENEKAKMKHQR